MSKDKKADAEVAVYQDSNDEHPGLIRAPHVSEVFKIGKPSGDPITTPHGAVSVELK